MSGTNLMAQSTGNPVHGKYLTAQQLAGEINIPDGVAGDSLLDVVADEYARGTAAFVRASITLAIYRQTCPHGQYLPYLAAKGVPQQRASELDRIGNLLMQVPAKCAQEMLAMTKSDMIALARYSHDQVAYGWQCSQLDAMAHYAAPERNDWIKQYRLAIDTDAAKQIGHDKDEELERERQEMLAKRKPLELEVATDEVIGPLARSQIDLQRVKEVIEALLRPETDQWKGARVELAHAARRVVAAIKEEADALDSLLFQRFGTKTMPSDPLTFQTLASSHLDALGRAALKAADADTHARTVQRNDRVVPKPKGAAPKTLDALLAKFADGGNG